MATLQVTRGGQVGTRHEINREKTKLGRDPSNDVVVDFISVSRHHAMITCEGQDYYVEDLRSRNGTYLNGQLIDGREKLTAGDEVEICEIVFRFFPGEPPTQCLTDVSDSTDSGSKVGSDVFQVGEYIREPVDEADDVSSIVTTLQAGDSSRSWRMGIKPEAKLRAVIQILRSMRRLLTLQEVLQAIIDGLFEIFPQAEQGFVMLHDPDRDRLKLEATRVRGMKQAEVNVSMTIVRQALRGGEAILSADAADDSRFNTSDSLQSLRIRSMMCVPLLGQDEQRLGVIQIDTSNMVEQFSQDDLDIILAVATPVSLAITNARFIQQTIESRALAQELEFAREIQESYLPDEIPAASGFDIAHYYQSAEQVGGDYFDCFELKDGRVCFGVGDVAGKGVPAALLMSRLYSAVRTQMLVKNDPVVAMRAVNDEFTIDPKAFRFITAMIVVLDPTTGDLDIVNAGHSPLLLCSGGSVTQIGIQEGGMPVGVLPDQDFTLVKAHLGQGDRFAVYSDGITEAMSKDKQLFGRKRLEEVLVAKDLPSEKVIESIVSAVKRFRGVEPQQDDSCLAVVCRL